MSSKLLGGLVFLVLGAAIGCNKGPTKSDEKPVAKAAEPVATAAAPAAPAVAAVAAVDGQKFGAGVTLTDSLEIEKLLADPNAYKGKNVRVEGMVTDVCPKRGCWFEMAGSAPGQKLRFKVQDGDMVFPPDSKGKHAVAEGVVAVTELTLEQSKEHAEYQSKEYGIKYDPASITKPTTVVRIDGTGAVFRDKK